MEYDPSPRRPTTRGERLTIGLCFVVFAGLLIGDLAAGFSPAKSVFFFMLLGWVPALVIHEMGHALAARSVGWRVAEMVIGYGPELVRFRALGTQVRIRAIPLEGYVVPAPRGTDWNRLKSAWIYFGGPGLELALAYLLLRASEAPFGHATAWSDVMLQGFAASLCLGVVFTLVPYVPAPGQASDGLGIILSFFRERAAFAEGSIEPELQEIRAALALEQWERAEQLLVGASRSSADIRFAALRAVLLAARGDADAAFALLEANGPPEKHRPVPQAELLHAAAWVVLIGVGAGAPLGDAERACRGALDLLGDSSLVRTTLGALLLARGRMEALETLAEAYKSARRHDEELRALAYVTLAAYRRSELALAERYFAALARDELGPKLRLAVEEARAGAASPRAVLP